MRIKYLLIIVLFIGQNLLSNCAFADFKEGQFAEYYNWIENYPWDFALAGLFKYQKSDWSICIIDSKCIKETYVVLKWIKWLWYSDVKISNAYSFLSKLTWKNVVDKAYILESKIWNEKDIVSELDLLLSFQNFDWWFGIRAWYESDLISTLSILNLINYFPTQHETQRNKIENYLSFYKNSNWALSFGVDNEPNIYLNLIFLNSYLNINNHDYIQWAINLINNTMQVNVNSLSLDERAYIVYLKDKFFSDKNIDSFSYQLLDWQWSDWVIMNINNTAYGLSFLPYMYIWPNLWTNTWENPLCLFDWNWAISVSSSCRVDKKVALSNNLIIESWAVVFVLSWAVIDLDMRNFYLKVKKGGGLLIMQGGSIY